VAAFSVAAQGMTFARVARWACRQSIPGTG
jgi:hypothetical protein